MQLAVDDEESEEERVRRRLVREAALLVGVAVTASARVLGTAGGFGADGVLVGGAPLQKKRRPKWRKFEQKGWAAEELLQHERRYFSWNSKHLFRTEIHLFDEAA